MNLLLWIKLNVAIFYHILDAASKLVLEAMEKPETSPVSEIFGANVTSINKCSRCCHQIEKDVTSLTVNLSFHESASGKKFTAISAFFLSHEL